MKRRNLIGSLLAGIGVLFTRSPLAAAASPTAVDFSRTPAAPSPRATVRVLYSDTVQSSWQAITDGGILVAGATAIDFSNAGFSNSQIMVDAVKAIEAAGGPALTSRQVALFGGQS